VLLSVRRAPVVALLLALGIGLIVAPSTAWSSPGEGYAKGYLKYYVVRASYEGQPERLWDIATRLLGDGNRYVEIFDLNRGRTQPDGGRLTDPAALHTGWLLVLPWDATGSEVVYGTLPTLPPSPAAPRTAQSPLLGLFGCGSLAPRASGDVPWAQLRLAPANAWAHGRGGAVTVAVLDSGVDPTVPALAGRVLPGRVATAARLRGDRDCSGHGTAMAAIVAARPSPGSPFVGMAPESTVLPIRIDLRAGAAAGSQVRAGVDLALSDGASVVMVAAATDLADPDVAAAVQAAAARDAVVVLAAPARRAVAPAAVPPSAAPPIGTSAADRRFGGVLRVGAVAVDDRLGAAYLPGTVDVLAPGVDVVSLGRGGRGQVVGSGTDFAVPFVAGLVALLRGARPELSATAIVERIRRTSDRGGAARPDPAYGWGVINPTAALDAGSPGAADGGASRARPTDGGHGLAVVLVPVLGGVGLLGVLAGLQLRRVRRRRP
jgi:subtilisin family serine protease